jgi:hypothetical protein
VRVLLGEVQSSLVRLWLLKWYILFQIISHFFQTGNKSFMSRVDPKVHSVYTLLEHQHQHLSRDGADGGENGGGGGIYPLQLHDELNRHLIGVWKSGNPLYERYYYILLLTHMHT